ncbi:MAG TPA: diguanylate cyclase [Firmicutes bacterium]|nr:diguanylate cyclase [Bacillota bacterium]
MSRETLRKSPYELPSEFVLLIGLVSIVLALMNIIAFRFPIVAFLNTVVPGSLLYTVFLGLLAVSLFMVVIIRRRMLAEVKANEALAAEKERLAVTLRSIREGVITTDTKARVVLMNPAAEGLTGWTEGEAVGKPLSEIFHSMNVETRKECKNSVEKVLETGKAVELPRHTIIVARDGTERIIEDSAAPICGRDGGIIGVVLVFRDITERRRAEEQIRYLTFYDKLTGLYNRAYFEENLKRLDTERELPLSLIMGDVNNLKLVNDAFGHQEGDKLLARIARILRSCCRKEDIIARWGGDEFAVILPKTPGQTAMEVCARIRKACGEVAEGPVQPSIALGVATKEKAGQPIDEVLREAESWMYRRKLIESRSCRSSIISSLQKTLEERTCETEEHARRLQELALQVGRALKLSDRELDELALLAVLHDIGKIPIPDKVLMKPDRLSLEEWETMRKHPEIGYRIAQASSELAHIADAILAHHERWDGTGYPQGLKGNEIPLISRIIAIADAYDAMTHGRPYKKAISREEALQELIRCAGKQFDPELVRVFVDMVSKGIPEQQQLRATASS